MKPTILERIKILVIEVLAKIFCLLLKNNDNNYNQKRIKNFLSTIYEKNNTFENFYFDNILYSIDIYLLKEIEYYKECYKLKKNSKYRFYLNEYEKLTYICVNSKEYNINNIYLSEKDITTICTNKLDYLVGERNDLEKNLNDYLFNNNYLIYDYIEGFIY